MLGTRGCRLGLLYPEIYEMQVRAIVRAALAVEERTGDAPLVEIMHPLVGFEEELASAARAHRRDRRTRRATLDYLVGTMIELPRACIRADEIAALRRLLLVRDERPHADGARLLARRRGGQVPDALPRGRRPRAQSVRGARPERRRRPDADRGRAGPRRQGRTSSSASAASTAASPSRSRSATGSGSTTSPARRTACRSPGWRRRRRR